MSGQSEVIPKLVRRQAVEVWQSPADFAYNCEFLHVKELATFAPVNCIPIHVSSSVEANSEENRSHPSEENRQKRTDSVMREDQQACFQLSTSLLPSKTREPLSRVQTLNDQLPADPGHQRRKIRGRKKLERQRFLMQAVVILMAKGSCQAGSERLSDLHAPSHDQTQYWHTDAQSLNTSTLQNATNQNVSRRVPMPLHEHQLTE